ncbi:hypothetical protein GCM10009589_15360 [Arthrobacter pascens]
MNLSHAAAPPPDQTPSGANPPAKNPAKNPAEKPASKPFYRQLFFQILVAVCLGILVGHFWPGLGSGLRPLGDGFIQLIKMIIAPLIFLVIVTASRQWATSKRWAGWA